MIEGYIPQQNRKKILLISDDIRAHSGVGSIARNLVVGTSHVYNWVNIGGARNIPQGEKNKRINISQDTNKLRGIDDSSVFIYPTEGFGNSILLRNILNLENPDAIFLITDPRYFIWLFNIENEIRTKIPIIYLNIWDDLPAPMWNKPFYESCDTLLGISKQTVLINKLVLGEKSKNKIIEYVPHGIKKEHFFPITKDHSQYSELKKFEELFFNGKERKFTLFYNSRNMHRKHVSDTVLAWKFFIDNLSKEDADQCYFILHTDVVDDNGTDLEEVKNFFFGENYKNIIFSTKKHPEQHMNYLYNMCDAQILLSSNEGWGLTLTESMLVGNPFIANVTGGMQDQMRFEDENGNWFTPTPDIPSNHTGKYKKHGDWAFPVYPSNRSIQGSPITPYIFDDRCKPEDAAQQIFKLFSIKESNPNGLKELGLKGREWALSDEAGFTDEKMNDRIIKYVNQTFETWEPREKFEFLNMNDYKKPSINHKLIY